MCDLVCSGHMLDNKPDKSTSCFIHSTSLYKQIYPTFSNYVGKENHEIISKKKMICLIIVLVANKLNTLTRTVELYRVIQTIDSLSRKKKRKLKMNFIVRSIRTSKTKKVWKIYENLSPR